MVAPAKRCSTQGLEVMIFLVILCLGKGDTCFKMSKVRLFKDLKKMFKSSIRKMKREDIEICQIPF